MSCRASLWWHLIILGRSLHDISLACIDAASTIRCLLLVVKDAITIVQHFNATVLTIVPHKVAAWSWHFWKLLWLSIDVFCRDLWVQWLIDRLGITHVLCALAILSLHRSLTLLTAVMVTHMLQVNIDVLQAPWAIFRRITGCHLTIEWGIGMCCLAWMIEATAHVDGIVRCIDVIQGRWHLNHAWSVLFKTVHVLSNESVGYIYCIVG